MLVVIFVNCLTRHIAYYTLKLASSKVLLSYFSSIMSFSRFFAKHFISIPVSILKYQNTDKLVSTWLNHTVVHTLTEKPIYYSESDTTSQTLRRDPHVNILWFETC